MDDIATVDGSRRTPTDVSSRPSPWQRLRDIWRYRELLVNLVRKELKVKYKNSALGFLWSLLNPALYLVVFYIVFQWVLKAGIPNFAIFLLAGLLPWNLFAGSVGGATASITGNASLVNKVWFPREILPLAAVGAAMVHFLLQAVVLLAAMLLLQYSPGWAYLPDVLLAIVVLIILGSALGIGLAAINVYLRDTQHLVELALLAWFWFTPIVYQYQFLAERVRGQFALLMLNPMIPIVITFQRAIHDMVGGAEGGGRLAGIETTPQILPDESVLWYARNLVVIGAVGVVLLLGALWLFGRLEGDFAEEL